MFLLVGVAALWTVFFALLSSPPLAANLISVAGYKDGSALALSDTFDEIPMDADTFVITYTALDRPFISVSSTVQWPVTYYTGALQWLRRANIIEAALYFASNEKECITDCVRAIAGVRHDFHIAHNTLTWKQVLAPLLHGQRFSQSMWIVIHFSRPTLKPPYRWGRATYIDSVDHPLVNVLPYVL